MRGHMGSNVVKAGQARCLPCEQANHLQEMHMVSWESHATHTEYNGLPWWGACALAHVCTCVCLDPHASAYKHLCLKTMHTTVKIHL